MEWLQTIFVDHSAIQAVIIISLISAIGLALGKIRIGGVSLGVTFVFFAGIFAGHFGLSIDAQVLGFAESFGLALFVYALGLQVGPGFFGSFRKGGISLNILAISVVLIGTAMTVAGSYLTDVSLPNMVGILCGSTTNTPALGAAQQTLKQLGMDSNTPALSCAVAYPLGVLGVIFAILFVRKLFVNEKELEHKKKNKTNKTYIAVFYVRNPGVFNKTVLEIARMIPSTKFVISRIWRGGNVYIPTSDQVLHEGDRLLIITDKANIEPFTQLFGELDTTTDWNKENINWNTLDNLLISKRIIITKPAINGKKIGSLKLRNLYGVNISRVYRSGVELLATPELVLQLGDRVTVIGEAIAIKNVSNVLGNTVKNLNEPNLAAVFIGLLIGLAVGTIPLSIAGISTPIKLGLAGGPIIVGILIGTFGPRLHMITYTTFSANLMLRALGLTLYLACLGLDSGSQFFETVFRPEGLQWILIGFLLTVVPILLVGLIALKVFKFGFGSVTGMICGSMSNPMALNYANESIPGDTPSIAYATVYPISMFLRVIIAQVVLMFFL